MGSNPVQPFNGGKQLSFQPADVAAGLPRRVAPRNDNEKITTIPDHHNLIRIRDEAEEADTTTVKYVYSR